MLKSWKGFVTIGSTWVEQKEDPSKATCSPY